MNLLTSFSTASLRSFGRKLAFLVLGIALATSARATFSYTASNLYEILVYQKTTDLDTRGGKIHTVELFTVIVAPGQGYSQSDYSVNSPSAVGGYTFAIYSITPIALPTASISASIPAGTTTIALGQNTVITANFQADTTHGDALTNTNINSPESTAAPGQDGSLQAQRVYNFTPAAVGTYTFYARVASSYYGWATAASVTVTVVDNTAPSAPTGLSVSNNTTGTSVSLSWNAATDNVGVTGYEVGQNGVVTGTSSGTSATIAGLAQNTSYSMQVRAYDAAGNRSAWSTAVSVTTPDVSAPSIPSGLSFSNNNTGTSFTLSWNAASDNVGVAGYQVAQNGTPLGTTTTTSMAIAGLIPNTTYSMQVRAYDAAGNYSGWSSAFPVTPVDQIAPTVPAFLSISNVTSSAGTLAWSASSDNIGVTGYRVYLNSNLYGTTAGTSMAITGLSNATTYKLTVSAGDAAGNWSVQSAALSVNTSDTTAPSAPAALVASNNNTGTSFTLSWSASTDDIGVAGYEVARDGASLGKTTGLSMAITGLTPNATYSMTVKAYDAAGNYSASGALSVKAVDLTVPSVPGGLTASSVTGSTITLGWAAASDNIGVTSYRVYKNSVLYGTATGTSLTVTGLSQLTSYNFSVSAGDAAGNWSAQCGVLGVITADALPPTTPSGLTYTAVECRSAIFAWGASTDNVAVTGYKLFRTSSSGTQTIDVGLTTAYMDNGLAPSTLYTYVVEAYDSAGNLSTASNSVSFSTLSDSDSTSDYEVDYVYDDHGDLARINRADGSAVATFTYNVDGSRKTRWLANNTETDCVYDDAGRMTSIRNYRVPETTNIELQTYGYDIMDRRTYTKRNGGTGDIYGYQADGELTDYKQNAANPDTTPTAWAREIAYAYDPVGNRLSVTDTSAGTTSYGVDHANRYSSITGTTIQYSDKRGNITQWNEWSYSYDAENRMTSANKSGLTMTFAYDPAGRQVIRATNGVAEYVVYCGAQQVQRVDASDLVQEYTIWGLAADELIAGYKRSIGRIFYHGDIQGSTEAITDSNRAVLEYYRYDVYGNTTCYDGNMAVRPTSVYNIRFLYTGQEYLAPLGLYNYKARFYSPTIGRFLQIDPAGLSAGDINLYRYCHNNGVHGVDPTGMATVNYGGFMEVTIGGNAMFSGTGQNEEKKPQLEVGIDPKYTKFSRMSFMEKYGRRSAPTPTKTSGNGPEAVLMKDSNGNVIAGASGSPVYMPKGYSLQMFAQLGAEVYRSSSPSSSSLALSKLPNFRQGGIWDTQRIGGNGRDITDPRFIDGATIAIGVYAASAGVPYPTLMTVMDDYAAVKSNFGPDAQMDEDYHHLAQRNVQNTIIGYELIQSGAIPIPPPPSGY